MSCGFCRLDKTLCLTMHYLFLTPVHDEAWSVRVLVAQRRACMVLSVGLSEHVTN